MARFFASVVLAMGVGSGSALAFLFGFGGCGSSGLDLDFGQDAGPIRRDGALIDPVEGGPSVDGAPPVTPSCERYCDLVTSNCKGDNAQYASGEECRAFCAFLAPVQPTREVEEKYAASVACRQYWADSPAKTDPAGYCLAAGPFGGNVCGDRCTAFCEVLLAACSPTSANAAYGSLPECATACVSFSYRDASADGGGEGPSGPDEGDTLNCRLFRLRSAVQDPENCALLRPDAGACAW